MAASWYVFPIDPDNPSYWRICRPYRTEDGHRALTDEEIINEYGELTLSIVKKEEYAWKCKWSGLSHNEAVKKSAQDTSPYDFHFSIGYYREIARIV